VSRGMKVVRPFRRPLLLRRSRMRMTVSARSHTICAGAWHAKGKGCSGAVQTRTHLPSKVSSGQGTVAADAGRKTGREGQAGRLPCPALPCPAVSCPAVPSTVLPCPAVPSSVLPCPAQHCPALPCPALSCPACLEQLVARHHLHGREQRLRHLQQLDERAVHALQAVSGAGAASGPLSAFAQPLPAARATAPRPPPPRSHTVQIQAEAASPGFHPPSSCAGRPGPSSPSGPG